MDLTGERRRFAFIIDSMGDSVFAFIIDSMGDCVFQFKYYLLDVGSCNLILHFYIFFLHE